MSPRPRLSPMSRRICSASWKLASASLVLPSSACALAISFRLKARPRFWPICRQMVSASCSLRSASSGLLNIR